MFTTKCVLSGIANEKKKKQTAKLAVHNNKKIKKKFHQIYKLW